MDYIYKDSKGKKRVGEVNCVNVTPYIQFTIKIKNREVWCHLEHLLNEWSIHFIDLKITVELAHPNDVFWNTEALMDKLKDNELSIKIAQAVSMLYDKIKHIDVSL